MEHFISNENTINQFFIDNNVKIGKLLIDILYIYDLYMYIEKIHLNTYIYMKRNMFMHVI